MYAPSASLLFHQSIEKIESFSDYAKFSNSIYGQRLWPNWTRLGVRIKTATSNYESLYYEDSYNADLQWYVNYKLKDRDFLGGIYYGVRRDDGEISGHQEVIWDFGNETSYPKAHKTIGYLTCQRLK